MKLYSSIVRPHMEYASQVWNPHLKKNIDELENTQKMALTLAAQWEYLNLCTFYKIIHNEIFFPPNILHFKKPASLRSASCLKLVQPFAHSNAFKSSHVPLLCSLWNNLPLHIVQAPTLPQFKKLLLDYLHSVHV